MERLSHVARWLTTVAPSKAGFDSQSESFHFWTLLTMQHGMPPTVFGLPRRHRRERSPHDHQAGHFTHSARALLSMLALLGFH